MHILIIEDDLELGRALQQALQAEGMSSMWLRSAATAPKAAELAEFDSVLLDLSLPDGSGLDLLHWLEQQGRAEKTLVITAYGSAENAVEALKAGAYDYLTKPVDLRQFRLVVASALGRVPAVSPAAPAAAAKLPSASLPESPVAAPEPQAAPVAKPLAPRATVAPPASNSALSRLAGQSPAMQEVRALIDKVSRSMAPVLLQGESGTGKELVARAIHDSGVRARQRFVAVNCGAIPEQLLEAEFFGYRKGAFTGAHEDREGFFQAADGGTLFLDEIGDLPLAMQSKLLRSIQERSVRPVGAVVEAPVNVRILSATHKDLSAEVAAGRFRQDLFYRLNVIQLRVPPLRERIEDVAQIGERVLQRIAQDAGVSPVPRLSADALDLLSRYAFPGNVRELENLLHRALALSGGEWITAADLGLPEDVLDDSQLGAFDALEPAEAGAAASLGEAGEVLDQGQGQELPADLAVYLDEVEREILLRALARHRFNRTAAGAALGLSLRQIRYRMARLGITAGD